MKVVFERVPDHERGHVLIERDDGVVYRMHAGPITAEVPHDLVHYTVEDALGLADGIWAAIAGGVVFQSMTHVSGRRPPHAAQRSTELIRAYRDRLQRAESLGGFVEAAAARPDVDLAKLASAALATIRPDEIDLNRVAGAVDALRRVQQRWRELPVGGQLMLDWPAHRKLTLVVARQRNPQRRRRHA